MAIPSFGALTDIVISSLGHALKGCISGYPQWVFACRRVSRSAPKALFLCQCGWSSRFGCRLPAKRSVLQPICALPACAGVQGAEAWRDLHAYFQSRRTDHADVPDGSGAAGRCFRTTDTAAAPCFRRTPDHLSMLLRLGESCLRLLAAIRNTAVRVCSYVLRASESRRLSGPWDASAPGPRRSSMAPRRTKNVARFSRFVSKTCPSPIVSIFIQLNLLGILTLCELFGMSIGTGSRAGAMRPRRSFRGSTCISPSGTSSPTIQV